MTVFAAQIATAKRLIAAKGKTVTFSRKDELAYDPATDTEIGPSVTEYDGAAVVLPAGGGEGFDVRVPGSIDTATNHRQLLVAAEGMAEEPTPGDTVRDIEGQDWAVVGSVPLAPDGEPIIYTVTIKR